MTKMQHGDSLQPDYTMTCFELARNIIGRGLFPSTGSQSKEYFYSVANLLEALGLSTDSPEILQLMLERQFKDFAEGLAHRQTSLTGKVKFGIDGVHMCPLRKNNTGELTSEVFGQAYEYHPVLPGHLFKQRTPLRAKALLVNVCTVGWICDDAREDDIVVVFGTYFNDVQVPSLVLRRSNTTPHIQGTTSYEIVGPALLFQPYVRIEGDSLQGGYREAYKLREIEFDSEDIIFLAAFGRDLFPLESARSIEKKEALLEILFRTRPTRDRFCSFALRVKS